MGKKIIKFNPENNDLLDPALKIRTDVFVKEQKVELEIESDGRDNEAVHYILFYNETPVGTARRRFADDGIKIERLAVLKEYRGMGFGGDLMQFMMYDILPTDKKIWLNSQADITNIYKKYGFRKTGDLFYEANIKHYKMVYKQQN